MESTEKSIARQIVAEKLVKGLFAGMASQFSGSACPDIPQIEAWLRSGSAPSAEDPMEIHLLSCTSCRRAAASLRLMEVSADGGTTRRLRFIREGCALGAASAIACAERAASFLRSLGDGSAAGPKSEPIVVVGGLRDIRMQSRAPLRIDASGRLVVEAEASVGRSLQISLDLQFGSERLELMSGEFADGTLTAIIDLNCCAPGEIRIPWKNAQALLSQPPNAIQRGPLTEVALGTHIDIAAMDAAIMSNDDLRAISNDVLEQRADLLVDYIKAWSVGNYGDLPIQAYDRFVAVVEEQDARAFADESLSLIVEAPVGWEHSEPIRLAGQDQNFDEAHEEIE